jgi:uncharacterized membrane protein
MTKTKVFSLIISALVVFAVMAAVASAATLSVSNIVVNNGVTSVNHNQGSFPVTFNIKNEGEADSSVAFTLAMQQGQATLTMSTVFIGAGTVENPTTVSASGIITFASYQRGNLQGIVTVDPQSGASAQVPFVLTINDAPSISIVKKQDITQASNGSIEITNNGNVPWSNIQLTDSGDFDVDYYDSNGVKVTSISLMANQKKTLSVVPRVSVGDVGFGGKSITITVTADTTTTATIQMKITGSFCKYGEVGSDLEIRNIKIGNNGQGDENEWDLLDTVEVEVEIENVGDDKVKDVVVEMGLFNSDGKNQISDLDFDNSDEEQINLGSLNDGDRETVTFSFKVPADFEDGSYKLTFKAYSDDVGEDEQCVDTADDLGESDMYESIDVSRESDSGKFIAFDNIQFTPTEGTCGDSITMSFDVYNIGDEDQDQVKINLISTELGINQFVEIRSDLNQGDKESISFDFVVPQDATDKSYTLKLSADYDYRNSNYKEQSAEDTGIQFRILGCSGGTGTGNTGGNANFAVISAQLSSGEAVSGGEITVKATVTNMKSQRASFGVDASGYQSWASLGNIAPRIVDLQPGASQDVLLTFTVDEDAEGEQSFNIGVTDSTGQIITREIAVNIAGASASSGGFDLGNNKVLWIIGAVNLVLIVLIVVVAVKVARR